MTEEPKLININEADVETLTQLTGVGETVARRIIEYRETVHPFEEVIELTAVPGVSERMVRVFSDRLTVSAEEAEPEEAVEAEPETEAEAPEAEAAETGEEAAEEEREMAVVPATPLPATSSTREEEEESALAPAEEAPSDMIPETLADAGMEAEEAPAEETAPEKGEAEAPLAVSAEEVRAEEPEMETETAPEPEPVTPPRRDYTPPPPPPVTTPGRDWGGVALGAVVGALVGTILTLLILAILNFGSLRYAPSDRLLRDELNTVRQEQSTLSDDLQGMGAEQESLRSEVATAVPRLNMAVTRVAVEEARRDEMAETVEGVEAEIASMQTAIIELNETAAALDERLTTVAAAAENFDTFLTGLRDLLIEVQGPAPAMTPTAPLETTPTPTPFTTPTPVTETQSPLTTTVTATVTITGTPGTITATVPGTEAPTATATPPPTRTPRPTATPIVGATATPTPTPTPEG